jgi:hypothetical protein
MTMNNRENAPTVSEKPNSKYRQTHPGPSEKPAKETPAEDTGTEYRCQEEPDQQ